MTCQHVLVIDDDEGIRETLKELLELEGFQVAVAKNGHEGLQQLTQLSPCLILLDLMMPVMNGWEFLRQVKNVHAHVLASQRVAVISAAADDFGELEDYGCPVIRKPMNMERLLTMARERCLA